ncbi:cytochrome P450 [Streptomyces aidingensis]|uniref:Pentalenene oxygenase n=1 Tax=Streptomyces aidingensis TaxID=910347 RepID=A0A1I1J2H6_9ACTN|nr:cytochrome P450 [Streptomyces aidingensis]SFC40818.1 pentalenene oxygenase [Streptomyces aidingensis]
MHRTEAPAAGGRRRSRALAPGGLPVLGHALLLKRDPLGFLRSLPALGDVVDIRLGPQRAHVVCHPELVRRMLLSPRVFDKGGPLFDKVRPLVGDGLFTSGWQEHRRQRLLVQPAFHPSRMPRYAEVMSEEIERFAGSLREGRPVDLGDALTALTARVTIRAVFATRITAAHVTEVQRCLPVLLDGIYRRMTAPLGVAEKLPTPGNRRFAQARRRLSQVIEQTVGNAARDASGTGGDGAGLLSLLLDAHRGGTGEPGPEPGPAGQGYRPTLGELHDQAMTLLIAGTETTAGVLSWAFHELSVQPGAAGRLRAELDEVLGGAAGRPPGLPDLPRLSYTRRFLTEVLRRYPPAWLLTRTTTEAAELGGAALPAGAVMLFSPYQLGRNPALFAEPDRFDPDRWLPERAGEVPRGAMIPFGSGNRKCPGDELGMTEATLTLAAVASRWRLEPAPGTVIRPLPKAALVTGPLPMIPYRR